MCWENVSVLLMQVTESTWSQKNLQTFQRNCKSWQFTKSMNCYISRESSLIEKLRPKKAWWSWCFFLVKWLTVQYLWRSFLLFFLSAVNFFHKKIIDASQYSGSASAKPNYHDLEINIPKYGSTLLGSR